MNAEETGALKKSVEAGKWLFLSTVFQKTITATSFIALARLLSPEDFGIIAILFIIPNFLDLITTFGFETSLIQTKDNPTLFFNSLWTFNVIKSFFIFIIIFFSAPIIANFFHIEKALWAVRLSGIFTLVPGFSNVAQLFFFKNIDFKKIFIRDAVSSVSYALVAIVLALFYKSFWPLFIANAAQQLTGVIITYILHEFRPRLNFDFKKLLRLVNYSKWIFAQNITSRSINLVENSLIGKMLSPMDIGLYSRSKSLAAIPSSPFFNIINRITFPAYSKIQDSREKIIDGFLKSLDVLFFITIPFTLLILVSSHQLIFILLGEKWLAMDSLLKMFSVTVALNVLASPTGPIFNALNNPKIQFNISLINIILLVLFFFFLIPYYGIAGAGLAALITSFIIFVASFYKIINVLKIKLYDAIKPMFAPLISSLFLFKIGEITLNQTARINKFMFLVLIILLGTIYFILIFLIGKILNFGPYKTFKVIISETITKK